MSDWRGVLEVTSWRFVSGPSVTHEDKRGCCDWAESWNWRGSGVESPEHPLVIGV